MVSAIVAEREYVNPITVPTKPSRGGFLRPFGCGWFSWESLADNAPYVSPVINPTIGAPQADIFHYYEEALRQISVMNRATGMATRTARGEKRTIGSGNIGSLNQHHLARITCKANGCRYHTFGVNFFNLQSLGGVDPSGTVRSSAFQGNYSPVPPRGYRRLNAAGSVAPDSTSANPFSAHCG